MHAFPRAGFRRRFGSYIYDFLLAIAVYMIAGFISFATFGGLFSFGIINNEGYQHSIDLLNNSPMYASILYGWNLFWVGFFFVYFWRFLYNFLWLVLLQIIKALISRAVCFEKRRKH